MKHIVLLYMVLNLGVSIAFASDVVAIEAKQRYVVIQNDPIGTWKHGDQACVVRGIERQACGTIKGFSNQGAILVLSADGKPVQVGDTTFRVKGSRDLASTENSVLGIAYEAETPVKRLNVLAGTHLSVDLNYPVIELNYAVTEHVVLGFQPAYLTRTLSSGATLSGYGASLTATYYWDGAYRGMWATLGSGMYSYSATDGAVTDSSKSPAITALLGWRERWAWNTNVGVGAGLRYMPHLTGAVATAKFQELYPIILMTVGYEL